MSVENSILNATQVIVASYLQNNSVPSDELLNLISDVYQCCYSLETQDISTRLIAQAQQPAVDPSESITDDYIICLEDGKKFKSLKRHLKTHYDLTPEQYRAKWKLDVNYPMVAPNYAVVRSKLARKIGLGCKTDKA